MFNVKIRGERDLNSNTQGSKPPVSKLLKETNEIFMLGRHTHHIYIYIFYHEQTIYTHIHTHIFIYLYIKYMILIPVSFVPNNDKQSFK